MPDHLLGGLVCETTKGMASWYLVLDLKLVSFGLCMEEL